MFQNAKIFKKIVYTGGWLFFSLLMGFFIAEAIVQTYQERVAKQGKFIRLDTALGWRYLPNLDLVRLNSDGNAWHISINTDS